MTERNIVVCILLSIVTCGIYVIYWIYKMLDEMYTYLDEPSNAIVDILIGVVTLGIYLAYKLAKLTMEVNAKAGLPADDKVVLYIIFALVGLAWVNVILTQNDINKIVAKG